MPRVSRRAVNKLLLSAPAAALASHAADAKSVQDGPKPSAVASCIARHEPSLSRAERARVEKALGGLEQSLERIRDFRLPPGADPAMQFRPLRSRRRA